MRSLAILAAFLRRDWTITRSYRVGFVLGLFGSLFNLGIFFFIGRLVDRADVGDFAELEQGYFPFILLGMVLLNLISTSLATFSATLRNEQITGSLEAMLATPASPSLLILGTSLYSLVRAGINALLLIALAVIFFGVRFQFSLWPLLTALGALMAMIVFFAAVGIAVAGFTMVFKQVGPLTGLVVYGLSFFGGVYFPLEVLPTPLYWLSHAIPFAWGLQVLRSALILGDLQLRLLALLIVAAAVVIPIALWGFNLALRHARRAGSLNQY